MSRSARRFVVPSIAIALLAGLQAAPTTTGAAEPSSPTQVVDSGVRVKPQPAGTITIDTAALAEDGSLVIDAAPSAALRSPRVSWSATGGLTASGSRTITAGAADGFNVAMVRRGAAGQVTATMTGIDANGRRLTVSDTVWTDSVGDTTVVSDTGTLDLELRVIDAKQAKGLLTAEQAEVARHEASGRTNSTSKVTPSAVCAGVCVSGTVLWTDRDGNTHVVRKAPVQIIDSNVGPDTVIDEVTTDDNGHFSVEVDNVDPEGGARDIYVDVYAAGPGFIINDHFLESSITNNIATGTNLVTNFTANNVADNNTAFSLQNAMVVAGEYVLGVRGSAFPFIDVTFPSPGGGSYYDGVSLKVDGLDRWDWDVMLHEYGHYIADLMDIEDNPGGSHSNENLSDTYGKDIGTRLAFGEGWPTYFAVSALSEMGTDALGIANIGDTVYQDTEDQTLVADLEAGETLGEDNENTIQSILWDMYDSGAEAGDDMAFGTAYIWAVLDSSRPAKWRLSTTYDLFAPDASAADAGVNCVFSAHNVSPTIAGPAVVALGAAPASPTITWTRGNGGSYTNNQFRVEYHDDDGQLLFTSPTITALTYTAAASDWAAITAAAFGQVDVTVVGTQTNTPVTGPYRSCQKTFNYTVATYVPLVPGRLLDSRSSGETVDNVAEKIGLRSANLMTEVEIGGRYDIPMNAEAVALNVTVVSPQANGFATVWPCGQDQPNASNLNFKAGKNIPNSVITQLGELGMVCFAASADTHLIADVAGFYPMGSSYVPQLPGRLLDTRASGVTVDGDDQATGLQAASTTYSLSVGGRYSIPSDAAAVVLNVTVTGPQAGGFATVWPCGADQPNASNLNFTAGTTIPNLVIAKLGAGGEVCINASAATHLIADVSGYYPAGSGYTPVVPARYLDTRASGVTFDDLFDKDGAAAANATVELPVAGRGVVPADADAVVLNVTVTGPQTGGFVTVWPCGTTKPNASNLNFTAGTTIANLVITKVGTDGKVCLNTTATTHLIADVSGYYP